MSSDSRTVSRDDVLWCFQHLLGRELVEDSAIEHFLKTEKSFESLVRTIAYSYEFRRNLGLAKRPAVNRDGFNYDENVVSQDRILKVLRMMRPKQVKGHAKRRVGNSGDGGYVMIDDFSGIDSAYSLGINTDVTWDKEIADLGIDIYQYDHTIDALPEEHPRFHWRKTGIASERSADLDTLTNLIKRDGQSHASNMLLKCDIEGHEWEMFATLPQTYMKKFKQIVFESHGWGHIDNKDFADKVEKAIGNISMNHSLVHVHANNCASYSIMGGVPIPAVLELTFVRNQDYALEDSQELFPTALDVPCDKDRAEFYLGSFRF